MDVTPLFSYVAKPPDLTGSLTLLTLRHGQSIGQVTKKAYRIHGDHQVPLTPKGTAQAAAAGQIVGMLSQEIGLRPLTLLSSHGSRAGHTGHEMLVQLSLYDSSASMRYDRRLDKQKFGIFDGLFTDAERKRRCRQDYEVYQDELRRAGPFHVHPPSGESIHDVRERIRGLMNELAQSGGCFVIVTHGTNLLCIESILLGHDEQWILDNVDTRGNCHIRMLSGDFATGFGAQDICKDPLDWGVPATPGLLQSLNRRV